MRFDDFDTIILDFYLILYNVLCVLIELVCFENHNEISKSNNKIYLIDFEHTQ